MPTSIPALVTPSVLEWARKESGYEPEPVAKKLQVRTEKVLAWEHGDAKPTLRQAQALAKVYHRPLGVFYLPQPPSVPPIAAEYRRLPGIPPGTESPELRLAVRVMSLRRDVAIQLSDEMGHPMVEFNAAANQSESSAAVGARLRKLLGIDAQQQLDWRDEWQAWRRWREAVEAVGVLVFQFPKVNLNQARGVTLPLLPMPVIGINSKETSAAARSYTLIHELTHLALALGHDEDVAIRESRTEEGLQELERFAEEVASAALIPEDLLSNFLQRMSVQRDRWDVALVRRLAYTFRVTPLAMATRLRSTGALTWNGYQRWKRDWDAYVATLKPRKGGFAAPAEKTLGRGGRPFAQLVLEAMDANRITSVDASHHLELSFDHFDKLRLELARGPEALRGTRSEGD